VKVEAISSIRVHELLIAEACFQQALDDTRLALQHNQVTWNDLTRVTEHSDALELRLAGYEDDHQVRVSLHSAAKTILQTGLPGFAEFKDVEGLSFHRPVAKGLHLLVRFHKVHGTGIGKMFELELGISVGAPDQHMFSPSKFVVNAFRVFGDELTRPTWSYRTHQEMELCLRESMQLLQRILPCLETCLLRYFEPWPKDLPESIEGARSWSARQAWRAALAQAGRSEAEVELRFVNSVSRVLNLTAQAQKEFPVLTMGRLGRLGAWRVVGVLKGHTEKELVADVPYEGPVRFGWHIIRTRSPEIEEWIDSTEAAAKISAHVGDGFDPGTLTLQGYPPAHWLTHLEKHFCRIDARSGEIIKET
jgi:hypothetical protein